MSGPENIQVKKIIDAVPAMATGNPLEYGYKEINSRSFESSLTTLVNHFKNKTPKTKPIKKT
ncbi:hypothetical protein [Bdellovibrio sp. KM01]|uniref:hypothetical protein n=1 Tax=Bdellovibrio sp. KM01 TaxID=2748865 RepID=UPI0015E93D56|nr:hypothetical protein [Bdellovibrio sp. KM01]QLY23913.1 hypothetical protein HW988_10495 [Bdellovibrio sp. KM01]